MTEFEYRHRVRFFEVDAQHHVFNARYLEYAETAFIEFFRELGYPYQELAPLGLVPVVVHSEVDFRQPAGFDEELRIKVTTEAVGTSSFRLRFDIENATGAIVAEISTVYVNVDSSTGGSAPIPEPIRAGLVRWLSP